MRNQLKFLLTIILLFFAYITSAQQDDSNYFQLSPRIGYDFPSYNNNTPYIDYKAGLNFGVSLDYYWSWFGLGFDLDYINNNPESTYPTSSLYDSTGSTLLTNFNLTEDKITRLFYGIGPNVQFRNYSGKFTTEINTRFGLASIKGGRTYLESTSPLIPLNFHSGYDDAGVFTFKGQLRFTYFLSQKLGVNLGAYYMHHFGTEELLDAPTGATALYHPTIAGNLATGQSINNLDPNGSFSRSEPCDCDISSVGVFAGITYKFVKNNKQKVCEVCGEDHMPRCCAACSCSITVTAKDKFTNEILPDADVVLSDLYGNVLQTGTTNAMGVVVFNDVYEDDYILKGKLYEINFQETPISKDDFIICKKEEKSIQKEIVYTDLNLILKGKVVECNTDQAIQNVDIILKDKILQEQKNTLSNVQGRFMYRLKQASTFGLNGTKDGYFSNEVTITTNDYDRNKSLFIDFEMCVNPCGQAIKLDNIIFNLAKWDILPAARKDLNDIVELMEDNPTIKVEMSSHTDARGGNQFNQNLSQKRAESTVNYLMSKGISRTRLIARGAGESELLNKCSDGVQCNEKEHTINRRTEFKVVCPE